MMTLLSIVSVLALATEVVHGIGHQIGRRQVLVDLHRVQGRQHRVRQVIGLARKHRVQVVVRQHIQIVEERIEVVVDRPERLFQTAIAVEPGIRDHQIALVRHRHDHTGLESGVLLEFHMRLGMDAEPVLIVIVRLDIDDIDREEPFAPRAPALIGFPDGDTTSRSRVGLPISFIRNVVTPLPPLSVRRAVTRTAVSFPGSGVKVKVSGSQSPNSTSAEATTDP